MNQLTDIAAKIEAFPSGEYLIGEFPEVGDFSNALTTDEVKALAAEVKRLTEENARLKNGMATRALAMLKEAALHHTIRDSPDYNECEVTPCMFCIKVAELGGE